MTEKRFRYVEATDGVDEHIIDYSTEPHFEYYTLKGATDKLNELTCKLKRTERGRTELAEFNVELMERNKELKKEGYGNLDGLETYKALYLDLSEKYDNLEADFDDLRKENEQLKKEYNSLQRTAYKIDAIAYDDREYSERLSKQNQQLEKENKELKAKVDDKEVAVEVETCKVMEKIFDLIDKKIKEADEGFEQTYDSWYQGQIDALKELKKELQ